MCHHLLGFMFDASSVFAQKRSDALWATCAAKVIEKCWHCSKQLKYVFKMKSACLTTTKHTTICASLEQLPSFGSSCSFTWLSHQRTRWNVRRWSRHSTHLVFSRGEPWRRLQWYSIILECKGKGILGYQRCLWRPIRMGLSNPFWFFAWHPHSGMACTNPWTFLKAFKKG